MLINISHIQPRSFVDGPGCRTALFMQGCTLACAGCQNRGLWKPENGSLVDVDDLAQTIALLSQGAVTITGGEPFQQVQALACLVRSLRNKGISDICVYSGYTWETIINPISGSYLWVMEVLDRIDILVDGPFMPRLDHDRINWRGSDNQRPIDVPASIAQKRPVVLNWDDPVITLSADGDAYMPIGLAKTFKSLGKAEQTRMCGQTTNY